jgi:hypothetical protein
MNTFSTGMILFASSALALTLHEEEGYPSPIDASGTWNIAGPDGAVIKCVEINDVDDDNLSCEFEGMSGEGQLKYNEDHREWRINVHGYSEED